MIDRSVEQLEKGTSGLAKALTVGSAESRIPYSQAAPGTMVGWIQLFWNCHLK